MPLVSRQLSEIRRDSAQAVATGAGSDILLTGRTTSPGFPVTTGTYGTAQAGGHDAVVTEPAAGGSQARPSTYLGGHGSKVGGGLTVNGAGPEYAVEPLEN